MNKISIKGNVDQINNRVEPIASTIETIYDHAIKQKYRFFSYGDSSLLFPKKVRV